VDCLVEKGCYWKSFVGGESHTLALTNKDDCYYFGREYEYNSYNHNYINKKIAKNVKSIYSGWNYGIMLTHDQRILFTGNLDYEKITKEISEIPFKLENNRKIKSISCGATHLLVLTNQNELYICGKNDCGQCGFDPKLRDKIENPEKLIDNITFVSSGYHHNAIIDRTKRHIFLVKTFIAN